MPLEPVRFKSVEDVTRLLNDLQTKGLINYSKTDTTITVPSMQDLQREFILGSDFQTYRLSEVLDAKTGDSYHSPLTFVTKNPLVYDAVQGSWTGNVLSPVTIPISAKERLQSPSNTLLSNTPLINALLRLNPNAVDLFVVQPLCQISDKPIIFPVLTPGGETLEGIVGIKQIFDAKNTSASSTGTPLTARSFIPNYALHDLLMINQYELQRFLSSLPMDTMSERFESIRENCKRVKKLLTEFSDQHPAVNGSVIEDRRLYKEDDAALLQGMVEYRAAMKKWRTAKENERPYQHPIKGADIIEHQTQAISNRVRSVIILAALSELVVTLPFLFYKIGRLPTEKSKLKTYIKCRDAAVKPFLGNELTKAYALIINPTLEVIQFIEQQLQRMTPASEMVDPVVSPNRLSYSHVRFMPPPPPNSEPASAVVVGTVRLGNN